ncbi:MAG: biopolymer transporter ExbD [Brevinematales bacterium]|nr:biopolymer transporter ExbD [Brevinematales bacterium]
MKKPQVSFPPSLPVIAMGDIAFLLLVFFLVTTALDQSRKLEIEIPAVKKVAQIPQEEIFTLFIDKYGKLYYKGEEKSLAEIQFLHERHAAIFRKPILQIVADKDLAFDKIDEIVQTLRSHRPLRLSFVCREEL